MSDRTENETKRCAVTIIPGGGCARPYGHEVGVGLQFSPHLTADECDGYGVPKAEDRSTCDE